MATQVNPNPKKKVVTGDLPCVASRRENLDWFLRAFDQIVMEFPDHWLAIKDRKIISAEQSPVALRDSLIADARTGYIIVRSKPGANKVER